MYICILRSLWHIRFYVYLLIICKNELKTQMCSTWINEYCVSNGCFVLKVIVADVLSGANTIVRHCLKKRLNCFLSNFTYNKIDFIHITTLSFSFHVNVKHIQSFGERWWWLDWKTKQKYTNITTDLVLPRLYLFYSCSSRSVFIYDKKYIHIPVRLLYISIYKYKTIFTMSKGSWMDFLWGETKAYILSVCTWRDVRLVLCPSQPIHS